MANYLVRWEIELDAETPAFAALMACQIMNETPPIFDVVGADALITRVDMATAFEDSDDD